MTNILKRCPFCGGTASLHRTFHEERYFAQCCVCGNRTAFYEQPNQARKAWQKRYTVE